MGGCVRIKPVVMAMSLMVLAGRVDASPIGSIKWTHDVLGTASAFSFSSFETSARMALFAPADRLGLQAAPIDLAAGAIQSIETLSNVFAPHDPNRTTLLVSSVAAPLPPAFHEPSAWVTVLIGLGIVALGSIRRRR